MFAAICFSLVLLSLCGCDAKSTASNETIAANATDSLIKDTDSDVKGNDKHNVTVDKGNDKHNVTVDKGNDKHNVTVDKGNDKHNATDVIKPHVTPKKEGLNTRTQNDLIKSKSFSTKSRMESSRESRVLQCCTSVCYCRLCSER
jgi:hypothetical protein